MMEKNKVDQTCGRIGSPRKNRKNQGGEERISFGFSFIYYTG
jgi:hypothetical protein